MDDFHDIINTINEIKSKPEVVEGGKALKHLYNSIKNNNQNTIFMNYTIHLPKDSQAELNKKDETPDSIEKKKKKEKEKENQLLLEKDELNGNELSQCENNNNDLFEQPKIALEDDYETQDQPYDINLFMHDNRIYYFLNLPKFKITKEEIQNCLLELVTTTKYRVLQLLYVIFRLTDNVLLLCLLIASITKQILTDVDKSNIAIFVVIGIELFYNVINFTTKIWILNRMSLLIVLLLYILYFLVFYLQNFSSTLFYMLSIRFLSFLLETYVDFALDYEIHNDLCTPNTNILCEVDGYPSFLDPVFKSSFLKVDDKNVKNLEKIRNVYTGSICVWFWKSSFDYKINNSQKPVRIHRWIIYFLLILLTPVFLVVAIVILTVKFFLFVLKCCLKDNCYNEITYI